MHAPPALDRRLLIPPDGGWPASLDLGVAARAGRSVLTRCRHSGPLRVQKALYPEGPNPVHLLLIHPPGGIAGGDSLDIRLDLTDGAQALLTTPGAGKWYKANGRSAAQTLHLQVGADAVLEWLPQETIHFNGCDARLHTRIDCASGARACGWEISVLGRRASAESFADGRLRQRTELFRDGRLLWAEQNDLTGGDPLLQSPVGWGGLHVSATLWMVGADCDDVLLDACRQATPGDAGLRLGLSRREPQLLLMRVLGDSPQRVRAALTAVWQRLRPCYAGRQAAVPRIWAT